MSDIKGTYIVVELLWYGGKLVELVHVGDHAALGLGIRSVPLELMQPGNVEVYYEIRYFHAINVLRKGNFL